MDDMIATFGSWIRRRRKALDLTQDALANLVGCSKDLIVKIEGDARRPSRELAGLLATHLQLAATEHADFIRCARAELAAGRLPAPTANLPLPAFPTPVARVPTPANDRAGTLLFLFTDIVGSTQLWEQYPAAMRDALARHDQIVRQAITSAGGDVFKTVGDAFCAAFSIPVHGLQASLAAQRALGMEAWSLFGLPVPIQVRMALHAGVAEWRDGDYFGPALNRTARLLATGHGGQILLSAAAHALFVDHLPADVVLYDLGAHYLKDLSRPEHIYQAQAANLPADFPPLRTLDALAGNLPLHPTPLIGRDHEVAQLTALLVRDAVRLVTLTGPGGTGKTRLSLQVAAALRERFHDGVFFVDLAPITDPALVASTIAQVLGVPATGNLPIPERLQNFLRARALLLVLDNFEQVVDAAPLVAALLAASAGLHVLVTSRIGLRLRGEHAYAVPPLALPPKIARMLANSAADTVLVEFTQYAAVALFIARARAVKADFRVTNATAPAVAEICVRLDGLPLAIELAAARSNLFPPDALLARLRAPLALLTSGQRDLPARQQTIRATIDWSYQLLHAAEQRLFRSLGIFVGGFTLEAAEALAVQQHRDPAETLDAVAALLDQSLIVALAPVADQPRYGMLELLREYALERLREANEDAAISRRHAAYLLDRVEALAPQLEGPQYALILDQFEAELPNIRAALVWAGMAGEHDMELRLSTAPMELWLSRPYHSEGVAALQVALARAGTGQPIVRARALRALGRMGAGAWPERVAALEESLALFRALGDLDGSAEVLDNLMLAADYRGDVEQAVAFGEMSLRDSRAAHNPVRTAWALQNLAHPLFLRGDTARGHELLDEGLRLFEGLGHVLGRITGLIERALQLHRQGDSRRARELMEEVIELGRTTVGPSNLLAFTLFRFGQALRWEDDQAWALDLMQQGLVLYRSLNNLAPIPHVLDRLGEVLLAQGDYAAARARFAESWVVGHELGNPWHTVGALLGLGHVALAEGDAHSARQSYREALLLCMGLPDWDDLRRHIGVAAALVGFTNTGARTGSEQIVRLRGAAAAYRMAIGQAALNELEGHSGLPSDRTRDAHRLALARADLGETAFAAAWTAGQHMLIDDAIAEALAITADSTA